MENEPTSYMIAKDFKLLKSPKSIKPLHSLHINIDCFLGNHEYNLKGDFKAIQHAKNFKLAKYKLYVDYAKDEAINDIETDLHTSTVITPLKNISCTLSILDLTLGTTPMYQNQFKHGLRFDLPQVVCQKLINSLKSTRFC